MKPLNALKKSLNSTLRNASPLQRTVAMYLLPALATIAMAALMGCQAKDASAPKSLFQPSVGVKRFPRDEMFRVADGKRSIEFADNMLFLQKQGGSDMATVIRNAWAIDDRRDELLENAKRQDALRARFGEAGLDVDALRLKVKRNRETMELNAEDIAANQSELDAELAKPEAERDASRIEELKRALEDLKAENADLEAEIAHVNGDVKAAGLEEAWNELGALDERKKAAQAEFDERFEQLKASVDFYAQQPTKIAFQLREGGRVAARIETWNPDRYLGDERADAGGARDFSTDDGSVSEVRYSELGGRFEFTVHTAEADYDFTIDRTRYEGANAAKDGKIYYTGSILRRGADGSVRRGTAKLVDRKE